MVCGEWGRVAVDENSVALSAASGLELVSVNVCIESVNGVIRATGEVRVCSGYAESVDSCRVVILSFASRGSVSVDRIASAVRNVYATLCRVSPRDAASVLSVLSRSLYDAVRSLAGRIDFGMFIVAPGYAAVYRDGRVYTLDSCRVPLFAIFHTAASGGDSLEEVIRDYCDVGMVANASVETLLRC